MWNAAIEPMSRGGEGEVFPVVFDDEHLVKIYHTEPGEEQVRKLAALVEIRMAAQTGLEARRTEYDALFGLSAWPIDVVRVEGSEKVVGYVMKRLEGHRQLSHLCNRLRRDIHFPGVGWDYVLHVAANLARCVAAVHAAGVVIGDLNDRNFGVDDSGIVRMWDADSVQLEHRGVMHLCPVGDPMHTPPELHGTELSSVVRTINHDCHGLAVVLFSMVMQGQHPFVGTKPGMGTDLQEALDRALFVYGEDGMLNGWEPPIGSPWLSHLTPEVALLFERAFTAHRRGTLRPTSQEWIAAIEAMAGSLESCGRGHWKVAERSCPWCHAASETRHHVFEPNRDLIDEAALAEGRLGPVPASLLRTPTEVRQALITIDFAVPALTPLPEITWGGASEWVAWEVKRTLAPVQAAAKSQTRWLYFGRLPFMVLMLIMAVSTGTATLFVLAMSGLYPIGKRKHQRAVQAASFHLSHMRSRVVQWVSDLKQSHAVLESGEHSRIFEAERRRALDSLTAGERAVGEQMVRAQRDAKRAVENLKARQLANLTRPESAAYGLAPSIAAQLPGGSEYGKELAKRRAEEFARLEGEHPDLVRDALASALRIEPARLAAEHIKVSSKLQHGTGLGVGERTRLEDKLKDLKFAIERMEAGQGMDPRRERRVRRKVLAPFMAAEGVLMAGYSPVIPGLDPYAAQQVKVYASKVAEIEAEAKVELEQRMAKAEAEAERSMASLVRQHASVLERLEREAADHQMRVDAEWEEHMKRVQQLPQANADIQALTKALAELN